MTIHLISVGKSILDFLGDPHGIVDDAQADRITAADPGDPFGGVTAIETDDRIRDCLTGQDPARADRLTQLSTQVTPSRWPARVSAELSTFATVGQIRTGLPPGDVAVLLTSDTSAGLNAALWNGLALTGGDLDKVRYRPDPGGTTSFAPSRGCAVICRVPGLDAGNSSGFTQAMGYLGSLGRSLLDHVHNDGEEFAFYLSGGFKATIPYLIGLAEGVRSLTRAPVRAWVLHDTTDTRIELPLRRLSKPVVNRELTSFNGGVSTVKPETNQLDGYAYEQVGRGWELTAFGAGLRNLYGLGNETI